ncbi:MAG: FAD-dependent oxidoreductase [Bradyrhizobiaceae bacterium]|nr:FAD-dependent oxidoreductase [Bradyrhizobiaceae bacterium]
MKNFSRRGFLAGVAAFSAAPVLSQPAVQLSVSGDVDVAIVGAGAAGIAAARRVASAGRSYAVFEAGNRIGGRIWTDRGRLGIAHDRGAQRISASGRNPLVALGRLAGVDFYEPAPFRRLYVGQREARDHEYDSFTAALHRASRAITAAGEAGLDLAAARTLPDLGEWQATVAFVLGPLMTSKDLEEVSTVDFARAEEQRDEFACRGGLGQLLAAAAKPVKVELDAPVVRIDTRGRGSITVETSRGSVRANAVIVTVSTNALNAGLIRFEPALPKRTADALAGLALGTRDRLVFQLPGNPFNFGADQRIVFKAADARTVSLVGRVGSADFAYAEFTGRFGREMADAGEAAMLAFVGDLLASHFGADARKEIGRAEAVRWSREPWILGGTSVAAPGSSANRRLLAEPAHDRIFFAGEALHESWYGTVAGAWISGERAADAAIRRLTAASTAQRAVPAQKKR